MTKKKGQWAGSGPEGLRAVHRAKERTMAALSRTLEHACDLTFPLAAGTIATDVPRAMKPTIRKAHRQLLRAIDHLERALSESWAIHDTIEAALTQRTPRKVRK